MEQAKKIDEIVRDIHREFKLDKKDIRQECELCILGAKKDGEDPVIALTKMYNKMRYKLRKERDLFVPLFPSAVAVVSVISYA